MKIDELEEKLKEVADKLKKGEDDFLDDVMEEQEGKRKPPPEGVDMDQHITPNAKKVLARQQNHPPQVKISKSGQWSLDKSFYGPNSVHDKAKKENKELKEILDGSSGSDEVEHNPPKKIEDKEKSECGCECLKVDDKGQWSLDKSNYGPKGAYLYSEKDNAQRKAKLSGEQLEGVGPNSRSRQYTSAVAGTAKQQADKQAKADAERNKKQPVKIATPEEIEEMNRKLKDKS